jgi:hypothetical protein
VTAYRLTDGEYRPAEPSVDVAALLPRPS